MRKTLPILVTAAALVALASPSIAQTQPGTALPAPSGTAVKPVKTASPELVSLLTKETGVTPKQAEGGAGSLFSYAKSKLSADDFSKVAKAVPGMNGLLAAAPKTDAASTGGGDGLGALTGVASQLGGSVGAAAAVAPAFQKLGIPAETVTKFVPVLVDYVGKKGGSSVSGLLAGVLK